MDKVIVFPSGKRICQKHKLEICAECGLESPLLQMENVNSKKVTSKIIHEQSRRTNEQSRRVARNNIVERFHAYRKVFKADVDWVALFIEPTDLNNGVQFKRIDYDRAIIKVFKKSILVSLRSNAEIKGLPIKEAKKRSDLIMGDIIQLLPKAIRIKDNKIVGGHNAFVHHPTASYDVNVLVDGEKRLISDNSKGNLEFEAINPNYFVSDSEVLEQFNKDLIVNKPELPSIQQNKLNHVINILDRYASQMELHLEVEHRTNDVMVKMSDTLDKIDSHISPTSKLRRFEDSDRDKTFFVTTSSVSCPITISKYDSPKEVKQKKVRQYLKEYGWGDSRW